MVPLGATFPLAPGLKIMMLAVLSLTVNSRPVLSKASGTGAERVVLLPDIVTLGETLPLLVNENAVMLDPPRLRTKILVVGICVRVGVGDG